MFVTWITSFFKFSLHLQQNENVVSRELANECHAKRWIRVSWRINGFDVIENLTYVSKWFRSYASISQSATSGA